MKKPSGVKFFVWYWLPVLVWTGIIFYLSGIQGLKIGLVTPLEALTRKIFHILEFGLLALLLWRTFRAGHQWSAEKSFVWSFVPAVLFAISDEAHQVFVENRSGQVLDALVDILATLITLMTVMLITAKKKFFFYGSVISLALLVIVIGQVLIRVEEIYNSVIEQKKSDVLITHRKKDVANEEENINEVKEQVAQNSDVGLAGITQEIPDEIKITVPFTSQAPYAVWDEVHEEACEEASLIMVKYFLDDSQLGKIPAADVEKEIQKMKDFQIKHYGDYKDSDMSQLVQLAKDFYDIKNLKVVYDFSKEDLKKELAKGNPIIVPTAGRELGNPNFTPPGPLYHNLVLIGYDGNTIITNDPGTRKGKDYTYSINILYASIHDFPGNKEKIKQGRKAMIVVK